jgi:RHS repeat-associated protein
MARPCDNGAPYLAFDGGNTAGTMHLSEIWSFVHGPGVDDPLLAVFRGANGATRVLLFVTDGMGRHFAVADSNGVLQPGDLTTTGSHWRYAGATTAANTFDPDRMSNTGAPSLSYFRNRVYDQATGRWTQEDPIGVAGGLNLYQYNGNNPVSFSDPYGTSFWGWLAGIGGALSFVGLWAAQAALPGVGFAAALASAGEAVGATALGSGVAAGVESLVSGRPFFDAFLQNFGVSSAFLTLNVGAAIAGANGGFAGSGSKRLLQGYVQFEGNQGGGLTLGSSSGLYRAGTGPAIRGSPITLAAHEFGHSLQFVGLSAFGGVANPWISYLGLGAPGLIWHANPWERAASWLGGAALGE